MRRAILDGDWPEVEKLLNKPSGLLPSTPTLNASTAGSTGSSSASSSSSAAAAANAPNRQYRSLLYAIYRQQFLELVDQQEYQKAFTYLTKRLKPLETAQSHAE